jgi:putative nucleotidyltransferase with HDIG domain
MTVDLQSLVENTDNLVSLPEVVIRVNELADDPHSSISDFEAIIQQDAALCAHLLKIVNSPFYGFPSSIDTISRAITIIGTEDLRNLALATTAANALCKLESGMIDIHTFWRHSLYCAIIARELAELIGKRHPERLFVAGLLHDVGSLALYNSHPEICGRIIARSHEQNRPLHEFERQELGFSHCDVGAALAEKWCFPTALVEVIRHHNQPSRADATYQVDASIIHIANCTANSIDRESNHGDGMTPVEGKAWEITDLRPEEISTILPIIQTKFLDMQTLLFPEQNVA